MAYCSEYVYQRPLKNASSSGNVKLHCAAFHTFFASELKVSTGSWKGVL